MPDTTSTTRGRAPESTGDAPDLPIRLDPGAVAPARAHAGDAGLDLVSVEDVRLGPGERALVDTGVAVALPAGTVGLVCPRSGLAARHGVTVLNGPGVVDAGYRGTIRVTLLNTDPGEALEVRRGDRIAQLLVLPVLTPEPRVVEDLEATDRDHRGFGSSGGFGPAADLSTTTDPTTEG